MESNGVQKRINSLPESEGISVKQLKALALKNWKWFAIFCTIGLTAGFIYGRVILPYYRISTTLLVKDDSKVNELTDIFQKSKMPLLACIGSGQNLHHSDLLLLTRLSSTGSGRFNPGVGLSESLSGSLANLE